MKNVIVGLLVVIGLVGVMMWATSGVAETQEEYGSSYSECIKSVERSVCKKVFLD